MTTQEIISQINLAKSRIGKYKRVHLFIDTIANSHIGFMECEDLDSHDITLIEVGKNAIKYKSYLSATFVNMWDDDEQGYFIPYNHIASIKVG